MQSHASAIACSIYSTHSKSHPDGNYKTKQSAKHVSKADNQVQGLSASDKDYIQISVEDSGIGISKENLDRIFEPFEQLENTASRRFQGTGLGLSLTKSLVELHGGKIWADSEGEGSGTTFFLCIPTHRSLNAAA